MTTYSLDAGGLPAFGASVPVGLREPANLALDPSGSRLYVSYLSGIAQFCEAPGSASRSGSIVVVAGGSVAPARSRPSARIRRKPGTRGVRVESPA